MLALNVLLFLVVAIVLFDFLYFGFFASKLGVWESIPRKEAEIIRDWKFALRTSKISKNPDVMVNARKSFIDLIVTSKAIYFTNTKNTYRLKIDICNIDYFCIKNDWVLIVEKDRNKTKIAPSDLNLWVRELKNLEVEKRG